MDEIHQDKGLLIHLLICLFLIFLIPHKYSVSLLLQGTMLDTCTIAVNTIHFLSLWILQSDETEIQICRQIQDVVLL